MITIIYNLVISSGMAPKGSVDAVSLRVPDLERAVTFYTDPLGLNSRSQSEGVRQIATPTHEDSRDTLALEAGPRGLDRVAVSVDEARFRDIESRLTGRGTDYLERTDTDADSGRAMQVTLPGGLPITVRCCDREPPREQTTERPTASLHAPHGIDHVTLTSADVRADAEFLRDELGFRLSDVAMTGPGIWGRAFATLGDGTHDLALLMEPLAPATRLHHVALRAASVDHVARLTERARSAGFEVTVDVTTGVRGRRAEVYVRDPAGHRVELTTALPSQPPATSVSLGHADANDVDAF